MKKFRSVGGDVLMPHWISETIMAIVTFVPALFVAEDSPSFPLIRTMFALLLIVFLVYVVAMRPTRAAIARYAHKASKLATRR
jgi:hypothetical protein